MSTDTQPSALSLRPFESGDAPAVARLLTEGVRGQWVYTAERLSREPHPERRWVAHCGDQIVATGRLSSWGEGAPDAARLDLAGDGAVFGRLYLGLLAAMPAGTGRILAVTREDWAEQMTFFQGAGFRNAWQSWGARLDLTRFDRAAFEALEERLFVAGYEVQQLGSAASSSDWQQLHDLYEQGIQDAPRHPTTTPDRLTAQQLREVVCREEVAFVVRWRGQLVASTRLTPRGASEIETEHTVVAAEHRGRGLASWLKAQALAWAQHEGYQQASTGGAVLNLPMLRVNTRLGYQTEPMWITWERRLSDA